LEHGLTPIAEACPAVHIFDRPTLFLGALWLPFRRDAADLKACLRACGPVNAVFGHADVVRPPVRANGIVWGWWLRASGMQDARPQCCRCITFNSLGTTQAWSEVWSACCLL